RHPLAFIVKRQTDDRMRKEFLLHKDKEKGNLPHIQAHLSLPDTKSQRFTKPKEPSFCRRTQAHPPPLKTS
ncbi:MAG: hypothetical protein WC154_09215, partial [Candidatus Izemoplasmatales bacterium]